MSRRADSDFLSDIREAVRRIKAYTMAMTYDCFLADIKTQDAVVRNLEIIGEATKSLSIRLPTTLMRQRRKRARRSSMGRAAHSVHPEMRTPQLALAVDRDMMSMQPTITTLTPSSSHH